MAPEWHMQFGASGHEAEDRGGARTRQRKARPPANGRDRCGRPHRAEAFGPARPTWRGQVVSQFVQDPYSTHIPAGWGQDLNCKSLHGELW